MAKPLETADPALVANRRRWLGRAAVAGLLLFYFLAATTAWSGKSVTFDETFHLVSGYSYWLYGDFRLQPENGNLPQRWAALPLLWSKPDFPTLDQPYWHKSAMAQMGEQLIYGTDAGPNNVSAESQLFQGRAMIALATVGLGLFVFTWARRLWGTGPAMLALVLFAFCPTMLSHGSLITSDAVMSLCFLCAQSSVWAILQRVTWWRVLVSSVVMSAVMLAKFSAPLIIPMAGVLVILRLVERRPLEVSLGPTFEVTNRFARVVVLGLVATVHVVVAWCLIWAAYNFRYEMLVNPTPEDEPSRSWETLLKEDELPSRVIDLCRTHRLLPEAYLYGYAYTFRFAQQRSSFFNGEFSIDGWRTFFPYCFLTKTPPEMFVLLALAMVGLILRWDKGATWRERWQVAKPDLYRSAPLWSLFFIYWATAIASHLNIGHRHIMPTYPPLYILAAGAACWLRRPDEPSEAESPATTPAKSTTTPGPESGWLARLQGRFAHPWVAIGVLVMTGLYMAESLTTWPNYLTYFNLIAGGPRHAYKHLVDSSLDWGQDLPGLKRWLSDQQNVNKLNSPVYLSYFGTARPDYYGIGKNAKREQAGAIDVRLMPCFFEIAHPLQPLTPGLYCISATMVQCVYTSFPGPWNDVYEKMYQETLGHVQQFEAAGRQPGAQQQVFNQNPQGWQAVFSNFEQLRFCRMCAYLREREPAVQINNSIHVYRLVQADIDKIISGKPPAMGELPSHIKLVKPEEAKAKEGESPETPKEAK
ncbi:MAG: hypothetical protein JSS27_21335 [Planctomycetes bacterium]|nr:hypothetical protein [Planctomycetota bacterium]